VERHTSLQGETVYWNTMINEHIIVNTANILLNYQSVKPI